MGLGRNRETTTVGDSPVGAATAFPFPEHTGPLQGIRVLDLTRVLSGPHAARMLCDLGADVIKIEPPAGDLTRFSSPRVGGMASYFVQQNVGKRNVSIDTSRPEGVALVRDLVRHADVLIENFRPGVMDRMGLGHADLAAVNPRLVYASINGYGSTGPWRNRRAYASVIGAEAGFTKAQCDAHADGDGHVDYVNDPHSHADVYTGMEAASGILAALFQRERTGLGQRVEVSMAQTMLYVNEHTHDLLWDGDVSSEWIRSFRPGDYPVLVAANDEAVVISGHPAERGTFDRFVAAMDAPEMLDDPRFADIEHRLEHLGVLVEAMQRWARTQPDAAAIEAAMEVHGLAMGVLRGVADIADSDWADERGAIVDVPDRSGGRIRVPEAPWQFSGATTGVTGEPKFRGEDNAAVLREILGLDDEAIAALTEQGVLSSRLPR
ncbi:MAG: putative CoA-transferase [Ilumatobacteraceae bacterium]|nr:putative CoA-transferase [Ilumatobacteraceae bacterium]